MLDQLMAARQQMENVKKELDLVIVEGRVEGILVKMTANKEVTEISIDPTLSGDLEALEDLIRVAVNKAIDAATKESEKASARLAGALLPGLKGLGL